MMKPNNAILTALLAVAASALSPSSHGAVLFSDNFESYTAGNQLVTNATWDTVMANQAKTTKFIRDEGTATPFGSPNQYLELSDTGTAPSPNAEYLRIQSGEYTEASNALTTLQFDYYEPTGGASNLNFGFATTGGDVNATGGRIRLYLNNGTIGGSGFTASSNNYSLNNAYTIYVIFNDTASGITYGGGTVAAGSADVWFEELGNGAQTFAGTALAQLSQTASYSAAFRTFNGDLQDMYLDNVSLFEGAATIVPVPEPSAVLLGGLGVLALLRRRR